MMVNKKGISFSARNGSVDKGSSAAMQVCFLPDAFLISTGVYKADTPAFLPAKWQLCHGYWQGSWMNQFYSKLLKKEDLWQPT